MQPIKLKKIELRIYQQLNVMGIYYNEISDYELLEKYENKLEESKIQYKNRIGE